MNNVYYNIPISEWGIQNYPYDLQSELLPVQDSIIENNFKTLYNILAAQKRDIQLFDLFTIVGIIASSAEINKAYNLLPGQGLQIRGDNIIIDGQTYVYGDYIFCDTNNKYQRISNSSSLGYLPILNDSHNILDLYYYKDNNLSSLYSKIIIDFTDSPTSYTGISDSSSASLDLEDGVFKDGSTPVQLVPHYEYHYNNELQDTFICISETLTAPDYKYVSNILPDEYSGIYKLYGIYWTSALEHIIVEICNGVTVSEDNETGFVAWELKPDLKNLTGWQWYLEVK